MEFSHRFNAYEENKGTWCLQATFRTSQRNNQRALVHSGDIHHLCEMKCTHKSHIFNLLFAKITKMSRANNKNNELHGHFSHLPLLLYRKRWNITAIVLFRMHINEETNEQKNHSPFFSTCINSLVMEMRIECAHTHTHTVSFPHFHCLSEKSKSNPN